MSWEDHVSEIDSIKYGENVKPKYFILSRPADIMREQWLENLYKSEIIKNVQMRYDYVLIDPDPCRNFYRMHGPDGSTIDIEVETSYSKEHNSISGRIVAMPTRVSNGKEWRSDMLDKVQVGDRVYFHFNSLDGAQEAGYGVEDENGYLYLGIHVASLYCYVRYPGEIEMLSNHILVKPIEEDKSNMYSQHGLQVKLNPDKIAQHGIVTHCGLHDGKIPEIKPGDQIIFEQDCEFELVIEGEKYYKQEFKEVMGLVVK